MNILKIIAFFLLVAWLPSGCAAAREKESATKRATQAAFCWPLKNFRYSHGPSGGWLAPRGRGSQHLGVDMFAPIGTPVRAIADGVVYDISTGGWGRGNIAVMIKHRLADGRWFIALYGHLRNSKGLRKGSRVQACSSIGMIGPYSYGSHLHFGVINPGRLPHAPYGTSKRGDHNNFIDPLQFLRSRHPGGSKGESGARASKTESASTDKSVGLSSAKKNRSHKQVRNIHSKNKKRAAVTKRRKSKKQVVKQKSKRRRRSKGKVRSLTGSSKRAVSARKRR